MLDAVWWERIGSMACIMLGLWLFVRYTIREERGDNNLWLYLLAYALIIVGLDWRISLWVG